MGVCGQRHVPAALSFWKETRYPLYGRLGGPQGRAGCVRKSLAPPRFDSRTLHFAASRHPVPHGPYCIFKSRISLVSHLAKTRTNVCETRSSLTGSMWGDGPGTEDLVSWQPISSSHSQQQAVDQTPYCLQPTLTGLWMLHELGER
jgi:hypothetical protein